MIIINTTQFKSSNQIWEELYKIYYNLLSTKNHVEIIIDELQDEFYGCTPYWEESIQILETKFGRSWDELMAPFRPKEMNDHIL